MRVGGGVGGVFYWKGDCLLKEVGVGAGEIKDVFFGEGRIVCWRSSEEVVWLE